MRAKSLRIKIFVAILTLACSGFGQITKPESNLPVKLELLSIKLMSEEEIARKTPDHIGPNYIVRFRLSNAGKGGIYFYAEFPNRLLPSGYTVKQTDNVISWLLDSSGKRLPKVLNLNQRWLMSPNMQVS